MASPFDALDDIASTTIAETMGEALRIIPRTTRQYVGAAADPDRAVADVVGVYTAAPVAENLTGQRESNRLDTMARIVSGRHEVWLPASEARRVGFPILARDLLTVTERTPALRFVIIAAHHEAAGDLRLILAPEDAP